MKRSVEARHFIQPNVPSKTRAEQSFLSTNTSFVRLFSPSNSGLDSVVRLWSPMGEDEAVIGEEGWEEQDAASPTLTEISRNNQGSMNSGEVRRHAKVAGVHVLAVLFATFLRNRTVHRSIQTCIV